MRKNGCWQQLDLIWRETEKRVLLRLTTDKNL